jgi:SAM-dependent methyltransferase
LAEFTGERVIPGQVDADLLNEHLARYAFAARLSRRKQVLDAGCGAGYGSAELARQAASVLGIDSSAEAIAFARAQYPAPNLRFEEADCSALPAADGSIDLVVAFEVIEHLQDWRGFLREARRVLAPAGQFIVSTPNKRYYSESRGCSGPNPFHVHEFEFEEFRAELGEVFPHVSLFLENHTEGVVFQPAVVGQVPDLPSQMAESRVDNGASSPEDSHFFVAVCASRPQTGAPTFVYVPRVANVLRERERHIALLERELETKNEWLNRATTELAQLNEDHQAVLAQFRKQIAESEERARWAERLSLDLEERGARIAQLQAEFAAEQAAACEVTEAYEAKLRELDAENEAKTRWAQETEARLGKELEDKCQELAACVELLHQAEQTIEARTAWAEKWETRAYQLEKQTALMRESRWVKLGRKFGLGPDLGNS